MSLTKLWSAILSNTDYCCGSFVYNMTSAVIVGHSFVARLKSAFGSRHDISSRKALLTCNVKCVCKRGGRRMSLYIIRDNSQITLIHMCENEISSESSNDVHVAR